MERRRFLLLASLLPPAVAVPQEAEGGPKIEAVHPRKAGFNSKIKITGRNLARPGSQTWVRFHPDLWMEVENPAAGELVLQIPQGAAAGPFVVRVGREKSAPVELAIYSSFAAPPPAEKDIVRDKDGYALLTTSDLSIRLKDFHGIDDAEALAAKYKAKVVGALTSLNSYTVRFTGTTFADLVKLQKEIEKEPGVHSALMPLGLRPR